MLFGFGFSPSKPRAVSGGAATDADAAAFFTATGITDATQKSAVNQLVLDLKSYNIWSKMKAIYPMVGGTSTTHKYNLKDPQDTNGAFRLSFSTGWTHASTGATPNGSAYANTFLNPNAQTFGQNEGSYGIYSRTSRGGNNGLQHGVLDTGKYTLLIIWGTSSTIENFHNNTTSTLISTANSQGFFQMSRTSSTNTFHTKGSTVNTVSLTSAGVPNGNFYFGARNNVISSTVDAYDSVEIAFGYIAKDGLTSSQLTDFNTAVQAMQTTLSRNV